MRSKENQEWFCEIDDAPIGPMNWEQLVQRARRGQLRPNAWVWTVEFGASWRPAATVPGLFISLPDTEEQRQPEPHPAAPVTEEWIEAESKKKVDVPHTFERPKHEHQPSGARCPDSPRASDRPSAWTAWQQIWRSMITTLFSPFDLSRWFSIGFCAWLSMLGGNFNLRPFIDEDKLKALYDSQTTASAASLVDHLKELLSVPLFTMATMGVIASTLVFMVLMLWIRARGSMMLIHRIAQPEATIRSAWIETAGLGAQLFWWRLMLGFIGLAAVIAMILGTVVALGGNPLMAEDWPRLAENLDLTWIIIWLGAITLLISIWIMLHSLGFHFMEPLLYCHRDGIGAAWGRIWAICRDYPLAVVRFYLLLSVGVALAVVAVLMLIVLTCCLSFVILALPLIGAVVSLPLHWLYRGYGIAFLKQIKLE